MAIAKSNTSNTGAFNGSVYQELRGIRTFAQMLGAPKSHANTEFPINTKYVVSANPQYFTEATENEAATASHTSFTNEKNGFSRMKKRVEITQETLNARMHIADANVLAEVGGNYFLTDAWGAQFAIAMQEWALEYNSELINSTNVAFSTTGGRTRGLMEAAALYTDTTIDNANATGVDFVENLEKLLLALLKEGVQGGSIPAIYSNQITGLENQAPQNITLQMLMNPTTRMWIEKTIREANSPIFEIERSRTAAGTKLMTIVTSLGDVEMKMDEDMPEGEVVIARFAEMSPVFQPTNFIGAVDGMISPEGAIVTITEDKTLIQGKAVDMTMRVGLDYGARNRIGLLSNVGDAGTVTPPKKASKAAEAETKDAE